LGKDLQFQPAQPLSAFVEAGELDTPDVEAEIARLLRRFDSIEALLLACTHYPALIPVFRRLAPAMELLDPGAEMAGFVKEEGASRFQFFTTGVRNESAHAARLAFDVALDA
jgi:glutamate racemase